MDSDRHGDRPAAIIFAVITIVFAGVIASVGISNLILPDGRNIFVNFAPLLMTLNVVLGAGGLSYFFATGKLRSTLQPDQNETDKAKVNTFSTIIFFPAILCVIPFLADSRIASGLRFLGIVCIVWCFFNFSSAIRVLQKHKMRVD